MRQRGSGLLLGAGLVIGVASIYALVPGVWPWPDFAELYGRRFAIGVGTPGLLGALVLVYAGTRAGRNDRRLRSRALVLLAVGGLALSAPILLIVLYFVSVLVGAAPGPAAS